MPSRLKDALFALAAVAGVLLVTALLDWQERIHNDRAASLRFVKDSCLPAHAHQRAVGWIEDGRLNCTVYENAGYGRAPLVLSSAVMELPE